MSEDAFPERRVRSFVRRQGRITASQSRALSEAWPRYGLEYDGQPRDLAAAFGRAAPVVLEIGFGNGEQLHHSALNDPSRNYLGIEVHRPGVGRLLHDLDRDGVRHARVYCHDAVEVLTHEIADGAFEQIRVYFPDPWPKTRQRKRRLIQPEFVALLARRLRVGGLLHLATDWQDYAEQMLSVVDACPALRNTAGRGHYVARPSWRIETHFERRGRRLGHEVWDLMHERV